MCSIRHNYPGSRHVSRGKKRAVCLPQPRLHHPARTAGGLSRSTLTGDLHPEAVSCNFKSGSAMTSSSQVESIFFAALEEKAGAEPAAYLDEACGADAALRLRVEQLLEAHP